MKYELGYKFETNKKTKNEIEQKVTDYLQEEIVNKNFSVLIKDVIKGCIRSIVNEEIQTKEYRKLISDRVENILLGEEEK